jgi:hypothetical protein
MDTRMGSGQKVKLNGPAALRQRLDRKKRAPINSRSLYKIEHSKLILSASRPAAEAMRQEHRRFLHGIFACPAAPLTRSSSHMPAFRSDQIG